MSPHNLGSLPPSHNGAPTEGASRREVYSFQKNSSERVVASLSRYHGALYLDLRVFFTRAVGGEWFPSRKGLTISPDLIDELEEGLRRLRVALGEEGR